MADLAYFGFLLSFVAFVDSKVTNGASSVYSSGRKLTPPALDKILTSLESAFTSYYEPTRNWFVEKGSALVQDVDQQAVRWSSAAREKCKSLVPETFYKARDYWVEKSDEVSDTWKEQGVIQGTAGILSGVGTQVKDYVSTKVSESPLVKDSVETFEGSALFTKSKEHFESKIQPMLIELIAKVKKAPEYAGDVWGSVTTYAEIAKEKVEATTDYVVAQPAYAKVVSTSSSALTWVASTSLYAAAVDKLYMPYLDAYLSPIVTKITETDAFGVLVDRLTPIKQE